MQRDSSPRRAGGSVRSVGPESPTAQETPNSTSPGGSNSFAGYWFRVPEELIPQLAGLTAAKLKAFLVIAHHQQRARNAGKLSRKQLAALVGVTERNAWAAVHALEQDGLIVVNGGSGFHDGKTTVFSLPVQWKVGPNLTPTGDRATRANLPPTGDRLPISASSVQDSNLIPTGDSNLIPTGDSHLLCKEKTEKTQLASWESDPVTLRREPTISEVISSTEANPTGEAQAPPGSAAPPSAAGALSAELQARGVNGWSMQTAKNLLAKARAHVADVTPTELAQWLTHHQQWDRISRRGKDPQAYGNWIVQEEFPDCRERLTGWLEWAYPVPAAETVLPTLTEAPAPPAIIEAEDKLQARAEAEFDSLPEAQRKTLMEQAHSQLTRTVDKCVQARWANSGHWPEECRRAAVILLRQRIGAAAA